MSGLTRRTLLKGSALAGAAVAVPAGAAVLRQAGSDGPHSPIHITVDDVEISETETRSQAAVALLVDRPLDSTLPQLVVPDTLRALGLGAATPEPEVNGDTDAAASVQLETVLEGDARLLPQLDDTLRIATYRLVQEGVTNVVRHARAGHCRVRLRVNQRVSGLLSDQRYKPGWAYQRSRRACQASLIEVPAVWACTAAKSRGWDMRLPWCLAGSALNAAHGCGPGRRPGGS